MVKNHQVYTAKLSQSSIIWYRPIGGDARRLKVLVWLKGVAESNGSLPPASVTCGLIAEDRDQLRNLHSFRFMHCKKNVLLSL